jgi:SET and MYND domain-containing protein
MEVSRSRRRGRCAVAVKDGVAGGKVLSCRPLAAVSTVRCCEACFSASSALKRCTACGLVMYCSRRCQKLDFVEGKHQHECKALQTLMKASRNELPTPTIRLAARILWTVEDSDATDNIEGEIDLLEHNMLRRDAANRQLYQQMSTLVLALYFSGSKGTWHPSGNYVMLLLGRIACNCFTITDPEFLTRGTGLYLRASPFNHSCEPNCCPTFDGNVLNIHLREDVKAGQELTISYTDLPRPSRVRQAYLQSTYFFTCRCRRCIECGVEDRILDGFCCPQPSCRGCCSASSPPNGQYFVAWEHMDKRIWSSMGGGYNCDICGMELAPPTLSLCQGLAREMESALAMECVPPSLLRGLLDRSNGVLYPLNWRLLECMLKLSQDYLCNSMYPEALEMCKQVLPAVRALYPCPWPLLGLHLSVLGSLESLMEELESAVAHLKEAVSILVQTHGNGKLVCDVRRKLHNAMQS